MSVQLMMVSVQCLFIRNVWSTLLNLSMITFSLKMFVPLWYFSTYICQYLVWKVAYYPLYPAFCPFFFINCNFPLSCLLVRNLSQVSSFDIYMCVCISIFVLLFFLHHLTYNHTLSHTKVLKHWVSVTVFFLCSWGGQVRFTFQHALGSCFFDSLQHVVILNIFFLSFFNKRPHWD